MIWLTVYEGNGFIFSLYKRKRVVVRIAPAFIAVLGKVALVLSIPVLFYLLTYFLSAEKATTTIVHSLGRTHDVLV